MKGTPVGKMPTAALVALLGETVEIRRSESGRKYPLYMSTCCGPMFLNTRAGQDCILENATMYDHANQPPEDEDAPPAAPAAPAEAANDPEHEPQRVSWWDREII